MTDERHLYRLVFRHEEELDPFEWFARLTRREAVLTKRRLRRIPWIDRDSVSVLDLTQVEPMTAADVDEAILELEE